MELTRKQAKQIETVLDKPPYTRAEIDEMLSHVSDENGGEDSISVAARAECYCALRKTCLEEGPQTLDASTLDDLERMCREQTVAVLRAMRERSA